MIHKIVLHLLVILMLFGCVDFGEGDETLNNYQQFKIQHPWYGQPTMRKKEHLHKFDCSDDDFKIADVKQFFYMKNTSYNIVIIEKILKNLEKTAPEMKVEHMDMFLTFIAVITLVAILTCRMLACNRKGIVSKCFFF